MTVYQYISDSSGGSSSQTSSGEDGGGGGWSGLLDKILVMSI